MDENGNNAQCKGGTQRARASWTFLLIAAALLAIFVLFMVDRNRTRMGPHGPVPKCVKNLKQIGQAIALYSDTGSDISALRALTEDGLTVLVKAGLLEEDRLKCPVKGASASSDLSDYEVNPVHGSGLLKDTWLVRDRWKRGAYDHTGNNNRHGKAAFHFLHFDMNYVGDADDYFELYGQ